MASPSIPRLSDLRLSPAQRKAALRDLAEFESFCKTLRTLQGKPLRLHPFQRLLLVPYFAGFRETLAMLPKGNGKTTLFAALAVFHMKTVEVPEVFVGAANRRQADVLYKAASRFAAQVGLHRSPGYQELRVEKDAAAGYLKVLSSDRAERGELEGIGPTLALVDEPHAHQNDAIYSACHGGLHKRDGRMGSFSTAGSDEDGLLGRLRKSALALPRLSRDGALTVACSDEFAFLEWALPEGADPDDLDAVKEANPLVSKAELAKIRESPSMTPARWSRYHCNRFADADDAWIPREVWAELVAEGAPLAGTRVVLGFDGSYARDCTALVGCTLDGHIFVLGIWHPGDGRKVPRGEVAKAVDTAFETFNVLELACDPPGWHAELEEWGRIYEDAVLRFETNQPSHMMPAVDRFHAAVVERRLTHDGNPVLARHVANCRARERANGVALAKAGETQKIDAAVAAVIAYERAMWHATNEAPEPWVLVDDDEPEPQPAASDKTVNILPGPARRAREAARAAARAAE